VSYLVQYSPAATRGLQDLPTQVQERILAATDALAGDPRPRGSTPLKGALQGLRRLRVGAYRVSYRVDDDLQRVRVVEIGHRSKTYEHLKRRGH